MTLPPCVLWADPGKMTGLAWLSVPSRGPVQRGIRIQELPFMGAGDCLDTVLGWYGSDCWIGWEAFDIRPGTPAADAHHAIEMIGVARRIATRHHCLILPAAKQEQRKVASPAMLKAIGWWVPGKDDAQSAAQHLLAWMLRTGNVPSDLAVTLAEARSR